MSVTWNQRALREIKRDPAVLDALLDGGRQIAVEAALRAPKRTGEGARSIRAEPVWTGDEWEVRTSWDRDHFYLGFAEIGTEHQRAEPFLRPAAESFR